MNGIVPTSITANRESRQLLITWHDGHKSIYPFSLLRKMCPCAECRGEEHLPTESEADSLLIPLDDSLEMEIEDIQPVGNYAINIAWKDGHRFGIYQWDYLRALCPCEECSPEE